MSENNNSKKYLDAAGDKINRAIDSIFKISTGALALSITFRSSLVNCYPQYLWMLSITWILLGLVPLSYVLLRFVEAQQDLFWWRKHDEAEKTFAEKKEALPMSELPTELKIKLFTARLCYKTLLISFILGIITFLLFAILNNKTS